MSSAMNINLENILPGDTAGVTAVTRTKSASGETENFKELFSSLLQEKRDTLKETLEELEKKRQEAEELEQLKHMPEIEIIRRIMPDGSILVTKYEDGQIASRFRKRPHMVDVPDPDTPPPRNADGNIITGQQKLKQVPKYNLFEDLL